MITAWWLLPAYFTVDLLNVLWIWCAEKHMPVRGGLTSVLIYGISILGVLEAVDNPWNAIPLLIGVFLGSFMGIAWKRKTLEMMEVQDADSSDGSQTR